jgi:hypothetical protein
MEMHTKGKILKRLKQKKMGAETSKEQFSFKPHLSHAPPRNLINWFFIVFLLSIFFLKVELQYC